MKLSKLLEKLYNHEYLTDKEYEVYTKLVAELKKKEGKNNESPEERIHNCG